MTRPVQLPDWATDVNYTATGGSYDGTPTKTEPTSGRKQLGWEPGKKSGAQGQNWWQNLVGQWIDWLAAGVLDGNWEIAGTLTLEAGLAHTDDWKSFVPLLLSVNLSGMVASRNSVLTTSGSGFSFETVDLNHLLRVGDRIRSVTFDHVLTHGVTVDFRTQDITGATHSVATTTATGVGSTTFDLTGADHYVGPIGAGDGNCYYLAFASTGGSAAGAGEGVSALWVTYDHPTP